MARPKVGVYKAKRGSAAGRRSKLAGVIRARAEEIARETDKKRLKARQIIYEIRRTQALLI